MERLRSVSEVLAETSRRIEAGEQAAAQVWPTGIGILDTHLAGGIRSGELALLGGPHGIGKTSLAFQVVRHCVSQGGSAVYFSFEHDAATLLQRLIALEATQIWGWEAPRLRSIREALEQVNGTGGSLQDRLAAIGGQDVLARLAEYGDRLLIHESTGAATDVPAIRGIAADVAGRSGQRPLVVVDYLQKVAVHDRGGDETERVTSIAEGLKDLALEQEIPVLAVVAADKEGLVTGRRLRLHHLRGSSALAYEPDIVLIMNDKYDVVARHHLMYDMGNAERFRSWVVVTIEKNRSGPDHVDFELRKRFEVGQFETTGRLVAEQLVDERVYTE
jgi:replicative DNA helicase